MGGEWLRRDAPPGLIDKSARRGRTAASVILATKSCILTNRIFQLSLGIAHAVKFCSSSKRSPEPGSQADMNPLISDVCFTLNQQTLIGPCRMSASGQKRTTPTPVDRECTAKEQSRRRKSAGSRTNVSWLTVGEIFCSKEQLLTEALREERLPTADCEDEPIKSGRSTRISGKAKGDPSRHGWFLSD